MKKITITLSVLLLTSMMLFGQNEYDAMRYSQQYYDGTARSLAMGNALVSLGGDMGALSYNPAASGVYRYSELMITPSIYTNNSKVSYLGHNSDENRTRFALSNIAWVGGFSSGSHRGFMGMNFAITANQTNNFNFRTSASGIEAQTSFLASMAANMPDINGSSLTQLADDPTYPYFNTDASWTSILAWNTGVLDTLFAPNAYYGATENIAGGKVFVPGNLNQRYYNERTGYVQDVVFNASGNVSDIFFFGLNVTLQSIWFSEFSSYSEDAENPDLFQTGFSNFVSEYRQSTSGLGVNVKFGFIVRPIAGLSIGGSISTPNWMFLTDTWKENFEGNTAQYGKHSLSSPTGTFDYKINAPFKWNLGIGYTFGNFLALGVDYERADYSTIKMMDSYGYTRDFEIENEKISDKFRAVNNIRAGLEFKALPQMPIRLGYNYYESSIKDVDNSRHYVSAGIGYASDGGFFVDLGYQQQCNYNEENYTLYDSYRSNPYDEYDAPVPVVSEKYRNWKLLLTLGLRF